MANGVVCVQLSGKLGSANGNCAQTFPLTEGVQPGNLGLHLNLHSERAPSFWVLPVST
jgi:hypothetical protein